MASLKKCIEMKCKDCIYDPAVAGTWRDQVEQCSSPACALWEVRPVTGATLHLNRQKANAADALDMLIANLPNDEDFTV